MRVLVVTHSEPTHLLGMVPLAWALRASGADVLVATQPALTASAQLTGLPVQAVGEDTQFWRVLRRAEGQGIPPLGLAETPTWEYIRREMHRVVPWWWRLVNDPMLDDLVALARRWKPDLVLWGAVTFAGAIAAEACGARHARVLFGADLAGRLRGAYLDARPAGETEDVLLDWLGAASGAYDIQARETLAQGEATIDYLPASLQVDTAPRNQRIPMRFVPFNGGCILPEWLRTPPANQRVCVTLGQTGADDPERFRRLLAGLADSGLDVVATAPEALHHALRPLPPTVRLDSFVPLDALAATCSVVVSHGGAGTVCTVARHGVPQLVVPLHYDEPFLGSALQQCGAGLRLDHADLTPSAVGAAVHALATDSGHAAGAERLQREWASMPPPSAIVDHLMAGLDCADLGSI